MKILSILNISNKDDLSCDSGYIFLRVLSEEFIKNGNQFIIAASDCDSFKNITESGFEKRYIKLGTNKYSSRFHFDFDEFSNLMSETKPDIIFNTQIELTSAMRSVLTWNKMDTPIISYCHYPALWANNPDNSTPEMDESLNQNNLGIPILLDILSALQTSDTFIIQSEFAKSLIEKAAEFHNIQLRNPIQVIAPPADPMFFGKNLYLNKDSKKQSFVYNHRLYKTYGTEEFINMYDRIYKKFSIKCIVSDPMINRSNDRHKLNSTPKEFREFMQNHPAFEVSDKNTTRSGYKSILMDSIACFAPLRRACVWSMASMDCMGMGIPVIAPNYASFPEFIPDYLRYNSEEQLFSIIEKLISDEDFKIKASTDCFEISKKFSAQITMNKFNNIFTGLLNQNA